MKLDVKALRYLSKEEHRALQAVELGQNKCELRFHCLAAGSSVLRWQSAGHFANIESAFAMQHDIVPSSLIDSLAKLRYGMLALSLPLLSAYCQNRG